MQTRTASFFAGLGLAATVFVLAYADGAPPQAPQAPNDALTPGKVASTDVAEVCGHAGGATYSQLHRKTSEALKDWVMREYGLTSRRGYEIDHRAPLCLGGADDAANLWPQSYSGPANAHEKDKLEAYACRVVCEGRIDLATAQSWFLAPADWRQSYTAVFGEQP